MREVEGFCFSHTTLSPDVCYGQSINVQRFHVNKCLFWFDLAPITPTEQWYTLHESIQTSSSKRLLFGNALSEKIPVAHMKRCILYFLGH